MREPRGFAQLVALLLVAALLPLSGRAHGGATPPERVGADWVTLSAPGGDDVVTAIQSLPHDPNLLGVRAAHARTKEYPTSFAPVFFEAADRTPLAGMLGLHRDSRPRPGVVIAPGFTQTKDLKFVVEVAESFLRNGWQVLTVDLRGHGQSRALSPAPSTNGWNDAQDILGAVRRLKTTGLVTSVAVIGFSMGGRSLVRAMAEDADMTIAAGIAVTAPLAPWPPIQPPSSGATPTPLLKYYLDFMGTRSFHEYFERSARFYGVDLRTLESRAVGASVIANVKKPLLMMYALDDGLALAEVKRGRHDGGMFSLAYRDSVRDHPHVRTLLVDRGGHAGMLYMSDPHWFTLATLTYLKQWQARDADYVTVAAPSIDVLADGQLEATTVTYRLAVRNHAPRPIGPVDVHLRLPAEARLQQCWLGFEGLARCAADGTRLSWTVPRLSPGKSTVGPFVVVADIARVKPGTFEARAWITHAEGTESFDEKYSAAIPQRVTLDKP